MSQLINIWNNGVFMLDYETKKKIDDARDILVGKIPDPKSQVEQITIALIYKFMGDMDQKAKELGGKAKFFTGEYEKYSWSNIFDPSISGFELVNLYGEALQKMSVNDKIPVLFRSIFKNAYLPYRDPETLKSFLKIIDSFNYEHSENLGNAYEYLLSVMGAQGDAGQFRTPRNIIDFIVDVVDPSEKDTILDPACGTAGFLISAYKHIIEKNSDEKGNLKLTAEQRKKLNENFVGYDISPDMIRISLVNMYLHNFKDPKISEYDTLTSQDRWEDRFDVILANPPFMTPKGGIKPHNRFSIQANRSEVLFVDYIAEHLTSTGKAGIIVPEGIIFQSGNAYKKLRELLVKDYLYAVVSLPAGVFNPYSGVKTSILLLDKKLAKQTKDIIFVKISNDGFGLGAQRRETKDNDIPLAKEIIKRYKTAILNNKPFELKNLESTIAQIVSKEKIAQNEDYNLSGDRYKEDKIYDGKWSLVELEAVCKVVSDKPQPFEGSKKYFSTGAVDIGCSNSYEFITYDKRPSRANTSPKLNDIGFAVMKGTNKVIFIDEKYDGCVFSTGFSFLRANSKINSKYLYHLIKNVKFQSIKDELAVNGIMGGIRKSDILKIKIPVPPLEIQERIVEELENYQNIIDGAKKVVDNYKPSFKIDPKWKLIELNEDMIKIDNGRVLTEFNSEGSIACIKVGDMNLLQNKIYITTSKHWINETKFPMLDIESIIFPKRGAAISTNKKRFTQIECLIDNNCMGLTVKQKNKLQPKYLFYFFLGFDLNSISNSAGIALINNSDIRQIKLPLPPIEIQKKIISQIEEEQKLVDSNKKLIEIYENKIKAKISEIWNTN